jgi:hypothetical protein
LFSWDSEFLALGVRPWAKKHNLLPPPQSPVFFSFVVDSVASSGPKRELLRVLLQRLQKDLTAAGFSTLLDMTTDAARACSINDDGRSAERHEAD